MAAITRKISFGRKKEKVAEKVAEPKDAVGALKGFSAGDGAWCACTMRTNHARGASCTSILSELLSK